MEQKKEYLKEYIDILDNDKIEFYTPYSICINSMIKIKLLIYLIQIRLLILTR